MSKQRRDRKVLRSILPVAFLCFAAQTNAVSLQLGAAMKIAFRMRNPEIIKGTKDVGSLLKTAKDLYSSDQAKKLLSVYSRFKKYADYTKNKNELNELAARAKSYKEDPSKVFSPSDLNSLIQDIMQSRIDKGVKSSVLQALKNNGNIRIFRVSNPQLIGKSDGTIDVSLDDITIHNQRLSPGQNLALFDNESIEISDQDARVLCDLLTNSGRADNTTRSEAVFTADASSKYQRWLRDNNADPISNVNYDRDQNVYVATDADNANSTNVNLEGQILPQTEFEAYATKEALADISNATSLEKAELLSTYNDDVVHAGLNLHGFASDKDKADKELKEYVDTEKPTTAFEKASIDAYSQLWQNVDFSIGAYVPFEVTDMLYIGPKIDLSFSTRTLGFGEEKDINISNPFSVAAYLAASITRYVNLGVGLEMAWNNMNTAKVDDTSELGKKIAETKTKLDEIQNAHKELGYSNKDFESYLSDAKSALDRSKAKSGTAITWNLVMFVEGIWWIIPDFGIKAGIGLGIPITNANFGGDFDKTEVNVRELVRIDAGVVYSIG